MVKRSYSQAFELVANFNDTSMQPTTQHFSEGYLLIDELYKSKKINIVTYEWVKKAIIEAEVETWFA